VSAPRILDMISLRRVFVIVSTIGPRYPIRMAKGEHWPIPRLTPAKKRLYEAFLEIGIGNPASLPQLRDAMGVAPHEQQQLRKRIQELEEEGFDIPQEGYRDGEYLYVLKSQYPTRPPKPRVNISGKRRAKIIGIAASRCQMCGRTVAEDEIKLEVDHRVPLDLGGSNDDDNLWAICSDCNNGKKNFFKSLPKERFKGVLTHKDPTQRIGEFLKACGEDAPPRWIIEFVARDGDPFRRLRELRDIGWDYRTVRRKNDFGRMETSYVVTKSAPWPDDVDAAIKAGAAARGNRSFRSGVGEF